MNWKVGKNIFGEPMIVKKRGDEYVPICIVTEYTDDEFNNPNLIAAAPALLEQLEATLLCLKEYNQRIENGGLIKPIVTNFVYIENLIKKAKGEL